MAARIPSLRTSGLILAMALLAGGAALYAQIEGGDRGAAPVDSSGDFEVGGISVDVAAKDADTARINGWRLAQRKGWTLLSQRLTGRPSQLADGTLDSIVTGVVIENEQIGPTRYIAKLGVLFNRARAGEILGVATQFTRSAPMLVIPVMWSGGAGQVFERATPWQQAWARYRTGNSLIDYVRPVGTGADPLLLNVGQTERRGRGWWRTILNQYGANDVLMPEVRLNRLWPNGPIQAAFFAYHGPDRQLLTSFTLRVENSDGLPALLDEGVARLDRAYQDALQGGLLRTDALLSPPPTPEATPTVEPAMPIEDLPVASATDASGGTAVAIQFDTPSAASVTSGEAAIRSVPGVSSATTISLALGGVSVMRVTYSGDVAVLRTSLESRGWSVQGSGATLRIRRGAAAPASPTSTPAPTPTPTATSSPRGG
ncbi:heavy-metal-associated domain-containing protein [Sphingomonas cannabina]|uniref:heavy-metal-associated domain-containing protein n=1 Tax=Sphingomonas cannabina TaxID=2899123 RepID=UPI001F30FE2A|nr:heavy-metal-associated domain-containing protein [Sphingomonas cannabina]UIJ43658.1 heavy-metal-associated domain-containing protein [Sphingomonas cannabina]